MTVRYTPEAIHDLQSLRDHTSNREFRHLGLYEASQLPLSSRCICMQKNESQEQIPGR